jgi:four helix bundle protein
MATITKFEEIKAWQSARLLCQKVHQIVVTTELGKDYKTKDQIVGASGSIMDNIAEGFGRGGNAEFIQFLEVANGSANEVQSQLYRILDKGYITQAVFEEAYQLAEQTKAKILAFINYLKTSEITGPKFKDRPAKHNPKRKT